MYLFFTLSTSHLEEKFITIWQQNYPQIKLVREYKFCPKRQFRFDFAHTFASVGIECQGGIWGSKMGHNSGSGITRDCEKICLAASMGWLVFPLTEQMINSQYLKMIAKTILMKRI
jgi:hypothetical protein